MSLERISINRTLVGVLAIVCLISAGVVTLRGASTTSAQMWHGAFVRVGVVLAAVWLALPTKNREAAYANVSIKTFLGLLLAVFAIAIPRYRYTLLPILVVIAIIGHFLRPRRKPRT